LTTSASPRRAALAVFAAAAVAVALVARFGPVSEAAREERERRFVAGAAQRLEVDMQSLVRVSERLQASPDFTSIVDAGGVEVRPARLFSVLASALPPGSGWGAVFIDAGGRAVAWAGDAAELQEELAAGSGGPAASFHVTRFTLAWGSPRVVSGDRKGLLVVSRRYPTGILRPDLADFFALSGGPSSVRIRAREAFAAGRLVALFAERPALRALDEDVARARARFPSAMAAFALLALAAGSRSSSAAILAARLALLLGTPAAESGTWRRFDPGAGMDLGLLATPADAFLTGLTALLLLRIAFRRPSSRAGGRLLAAAAVPLSLLPVLLGRALGAGNTGLLDSMNLVPADLASWLASTGGVGLLTAATGTAALLLSRLGAPRHPRLLASAGIAFLGAWLLLPSTAAASALAVAGSLLLPRALAPRLSRLSSADTLGRLATVVFLAAAAVLGGTAGLCAGRLSRLTDALSSAAAEQASRESDDGPRRFEARVQGGDEAAWLPAGKKTLLSDLARALWVRGADASFPGPGDTLRILDGSRKTVSAFGLTRPDPGVESRVTPTRIPAGLFAEWVRVPWPRESERDPLLAAAVEAYVPERVLVERIEYDAAGRATGPRRADPAELPADLLAEARLAGHASGQRLAADGATRLVVRALSPGFVAYVARSESPLVSAGAALAAGEAALPVVLLVLLAAPRRRGAAGRLEPFFATYRARLLALVLLFGALPLAGSVALVRLTLERHAGRETERRARSLIAEGRRAALEAGGGELGPRELNAAAGVIGVDLLLYRDGRLEFASRALPVSAEVAGDRLSAPVAEALAEGKREASAVARRAAPGGPRTVEAAETLPGDGHDSIAVVVAEDEAGRGTLDALVLLAVAVALGAVGLGGRAALALGKPVEDLIAAADRVGSGQPAPPIARPSNVDLSRLVEAFETMGERVRERTESLARERASAVGLLSSLTAAVVLFRRGDGAVLLANPAAERLLPGDSLGDRLAPAAWAPVRFVLEVSGSSGGPVERRVTVALGGRDRVLRVVVRHLRPDDPEGRSILVLEDLTEFMRADRLGAWVDAARAIAHDVKNPLTPIRLAAERLLRLELKNEPASPGVVAEAGSNILRQVGILTERIGRLSRFSDPAVLERRPFDAARTEALLKEVASDYAGLPRIRIEAGVAPGLPPFAADPAFVRDAMTNFVVNALEAFGGAEGRIRLTAAPEEIGAKLAGVRFVCEDDGPGIPGDAVERLFEPAFSTKSRGSGMGLAAVRRAVERHGGTVFAAARPGGGLAIGFVLPSL
jgi:nitrogen-specific signal transduction histidine kinase